MAGKRIKLFFLLFIFSTSSFGKSYGQDLLNNVKDNSHLITQLKDLYRAFHINHVIVEQKEWLNVNLNVDTTGVNQLLVRFIKECDSLKQTSFYNDTLNTKVKTYLTLTIRSYKIAETKGLNSVEFKNVFKKYKKQKERYMNYLFTNYSTDHFVSITESQYWGNINKKNFIKSTEYSRYKALKEINLQKSLKLLDSIARNTNNFQEYSIYQIELADQYVKNEGTLGVNASDTAIKIYKGILDKNKFSLYLFEAWLKWRDVTQEGYGASKISDIPNDYYDKVRKKVALTILKYITKHENDEMAINEFLLIATHKIIRRFGDYPYGNQNTVEYHELFDEK